MLRLGHFPGASPAGSAGSPACRRRLAIVCRRGRLTVLMLEAVEAGVNGTRCAKGHRSPRRNRPHPPRSLWSRAAPGATLTAETAGCYLSSAPRLAGMKQLVVNADDFGLTEGINRGILEAHRRGILTSTTLLANGAALESAVALAIESPQLGVGIHLNLTQGRPVSDPYRVPSLVDEGGCFFGGPASLARRILLGKVRPAEVEREFAAQIEKVRGAGLEMTHL